MRSGFRKLANHQEYQNPLLIETDIILHLPIVKKIIEDGLIGK